jgi:Kef-type K+ transport system membrane component KefB
MQKCSVICSCFGIALMSAPNVASRASGAGPLRGRDRREGGTMLAITCAAADDITAWCLLAAVIAIVKAGPAANALFVIALSAAYVSLMIYVVRPFLVKLAGVYASKESFNKTVIAFIFLLLLISAFIAEIIGIHALFGAFLAGAIIPQNLRFKEILAEKQAREAKQTADRKAQAALDDIRRMREI